MACTLVKKIEKKEKKGEKKEEKKMKMKMDLKMKVKMKIFAVFLHCVLRATFVHARTRQWAVRTYG